MPIFYILRHAHKAKGDYYNAHLHHQDEPISQRGQEQARKLWPSLCDKEISAIYVSAYQRTRQTIEHFAHRLGITPIVDERLNEIDNGRIEGLSEEEIQQKYPEAWRGFRERSADFRWDFHVDFCGMMEITYQPDYQTWKLIRFNQKPF